MNRIQIIGIVIAIVGVIFYFLVDREPYTTIAGLITGIGVGGILFGPKIIAGYKK